MSVPSVPAFDPRSLRSLQNLAKQGDSPEALRAAAKQFEAVMLQQMLKAMRATVPRNDFTSSDAERMFQEMSDQQLAQNLAAGHGLGLGELLARVGQIMFGRALAGHAVHHLSAARGGDHPQVIRLKGGLTGGHLAPGDDRALQLGRAAIQRLPGITRRGSAGAQLAARLACIAPVRHGSQRRQGQRHRAHQLHPGRQKRETAHAASAMFQAPLGRRLPR